MKPALETEAFSLSEEFLEIVRTNSNHDPTLNGKVTLSHQTSENDPEKQIQSNDVISKESRSFQNPGSDAKSRNKCQIPTMEIQNQDYDVISEQVTTGPQTSEQHGRSKIPLPIRRQNIKRKLYLKLDKQH